MGILSENTINAMLMSYYIEHYGFRSDEEWLPSEALNIRRFVRDGRLVILRCHIVNGSVSEKVAEYAKQRAAH